MKISRVKVDNYRNIGSINVAFNPDCNYIIGENNLGKSNLLNLLFSTCNVRPFEEEDFTDPDNPIEVFIDISLEVGELGFFSDNFSPEDSTIIHLCYRQFFGDAYGKITCIDTEEVIQPKQLKKINFYKYESTATPSKELKVDSKTGGMGMFMRGLIERFIEEAECEHFLQNEAITGLANFINGNLAKIQGFKNYQIEASIDSNSSEMLSSMLYLSDGERKIDRTGAGVQYIAMASISLLCYIMSLYNGKAIKFSERVFSDTEGRKYLPIILAIDEPEVHLHPYLQRSLIGFYKRILKNKDDDFLFLLKDCFGIDGLCGQIIIVTHSTDALVGDYRNLIRFYKENGQISVVCGSNLSAVIDDADYEKHLAMHFPELKEAFYSHCVIFVEGVTEYGCMHQFAETLGISLDDNSICIVSSDGEGSTKPMRELMSWFHIPSVAIYDGDVRDKVEETGTEFFTNELCIEIEVTKKLCDTDNYELVKKIAKEYDPRVDSKVFQKNQARKHYKKMKLDPESYEECTVTKLENDSPEFFHVFSAWFMANKGIMLGRVFGNLLSADLIPQCYVDALNKAVEVSQNA